jgi:plastocyanin
MRRILIYGALFASVGVLVAGTVTARVAADHTTGPREVTLRDDCDPGDTAWNATGGCSLPEGAVTAAEFGAQRLSPLAPSVIGHLAWWFDPNYLKVKEGKEIHVRNEGGRTHTFTEVKAFGGGRIPGLNTSQPGIPPLTPAPECVSPGVVDLAGGSADVVAGLAPGDHRFQCCIHPWMRTLVKVMPE